MQQLTGAFTDDLSTFTAQKATITDLNTSGHTPGRGRILPLAAQPTITRPWTIYGFTVQGHGFLAVGAGVQPYGRLGKLLAGLLFGGTFGAERCHIYTAAEHTQPARALGRHPGPIVSARINCERHGLAADQQRLLLRIIAIAAAPGHAPRRPIGDWPMAHARAS
ncbi:MAG: hypothetical protein ACTHMY_01650 [Solirubrobacteraceae bacterium]